MNRRTANPGNPQGSFTEALADALLNDWSEGADILIDMHGGDVGEDLTRYVIFQASEDATVNRRNEAFARCFNAPLMLGLSPDVGGQRGRSCQALAATGRAGLVTESGKNALLAGHDVDYHADGIVNVARLLDTIDEAVALPRREPVLLGDYRFFASPAAGLIYPNVRSGAAVKSGELVAEIRDVFHVKVAEFRAPRDGWIMWMTSHLLVGKDEWIGAIGSAEFDRESKLKTTTFN